MNIEIMNLSSSKIQVDSGGVLEDYCISMSDVQVSVRIIPRGDA